LVVVAVKRVLTPAALQQQVQQQEMQERGAHLWQAVPEVPVQLLRRGEQGEQELTVEEEEVPERQLNRLVPEEIRVQRPVAVAAVQR
jgi:hypothetical protein